MPRGLLPRPGARLVNVAPFAEDLNRQASKQPGRGGEREMRRVIGERCDLIWEANCPPARMHSSRNTVKRMMNIDGEIHQAARCEAPHQLSHYLGRRLRMIYSVVANDYVEALIENRERLAHLGYRLHKPLPTWKQRPIIDG